MIAEANVAGATLPGIPVVWTGFTPGVAWASTQAGGMPCLAAQSKTRSPGCQFGGMGVAFIRPSVEQFGDCAASSPHNDGSLSVL